MTKNGKGTTTYSIVPFIILPGKYYGAYLQAMRHAMGAGLINKNNFQLCIQEYQIKNLIFAKGIKMRYDFDKEDKGPVIKKVILSLLIWFVEIAAVIGLAYFIANYALEKTVMPGQSMEKTLKDQDKIIVNKFSYVFHKPKRYDVIVFKQSNKEHSYLNVKRVIGLPGETVQIKGGKVYINGEELKERTVTDSIENPGLAEEDIKLDENEFFVLGDNRNNSEDSRFANIGNIVKEDIIGKAWIRQNGFAFINKLNIAKEEE